MLDIRFIRENAELVSEKSKQKGYEVNVQRLLELDGKRRDLLKQAEDVRAQRNELTEQSKGAKPSEEQMARGKELREKIGGLEAELGPVDSEFTALLEAVPNIFPDDTPKGGEEANREEKKWGNTADKDFEIKDHLTWGEEHGLIDFERGVKVAGNKFYFLKGALVELEMAIFKFTMEIAKNNGFTPMSVPHLVNTKVLEGAGFSARGQEQQIYKIEGQDLNLIATSEIPITGYHADEIIEEDKLPLRYAGISPAYRVEGGAYGKHNRGLFRTHQFNKLELYVFCKGDLAESEQWHQKMVAIEEEICQKLELPYRIVRIAAGDLGAPAYKKYDIEYWSPADKAYRELTSCSNVTDYQARRLNIKHRKEDGATEYVHTLNGTAAATSRLIVAIIENYQEAGGKVGVPQVLRPYMGGQMTL